MLILNLSWCSLTLPSQSFFHRVLRFPPHHHSVGQNFDRIKQTSTYPTRRVPATVWCLFLLCFFPWNTRTPAYFTSVQCLCAWSGVGVLYSIKRLFALNTKWFSIGIAPIVRVLKLIHACFHHYRPLNVSGPVVRTEMKSVGNEPSEQLKFLVGFGFYCVNKTRSWVCLRETRAAVNVFVCDLAQLTIWHPLGEPLVLQFYARINTVDVFGWGLCAKS